MSPRDVAFGFALGAVGVTVLYASLAPSFVERATVQAIEGLIDATPIAGSALRPFTSVVGRQVRIAVARKVAPWTL